MKKHLERISKFFFAESEASADESQPLPDADAIKDFPQEAQSIIEAQQQRIRDLEAANARQRAEVEKLHASVAEKDKKAGELEAKTKDQEKEIETLQELLRVKDERIAELERRLKLDSTNSGKPPGSDGLGKKKPRTRSLRDKSKTKPGGQTGHPGHTLQQTDKPDHIVQLLPQTCQGCGKALDAKPNFDPHIRQVFDVPKPRLECTQYESHACCCEACGTTTRAPFPEHVTAPVMYGEGVRAYARYFNIHQFIPEERTAELLKDIFNCPISAATVANFTKGCANAFRGFTEAVRDIILKAPVKHMDETGFRVEGKLHWMHIMSTNDLTYYRIEKQRGKMQEGVTGTIVHDHLKSYYTILGVIHVLCNQHHLRELKDVGDNCKEPWGPQMARILRQACHAKNLAEAKDVPLKRSFVELFHRRYDAILTEAIAYHEGLEPLPQKKKGRVKRRTGHNLALRLRDFKQDVVRFLENPDIPFTNNQGEQDGRMVKLRQKISGCFRSLQGAMDFATNRAVLSTARKQGWNIIETLMSDPNDLIRRLTPDVLQV